MTIRKTFLQMLNGGSSLNGDYEAKTNLKIPGCRLEEQTYKLKLDEEKNVYYFPTCINITKCSGCCPGMMQCRDMSPEIKEIQVLRVNASSYSAIGEAEIQNGVFIRRQISNDKTCVCECNIPQRNCPQETHIFNGMDCTCLCKDMHQMVKCHHLRRSHRWDEGRCKCVCKQTIICSTGMEFDDDKCRCKPTHEFKIKADTLEYLFGK